VLIEQPDPEERYSYVFEQRSGPRSDSGESGAGGHPGARQLSRGSRDCRVCRPSE
jgi:hypothetical protein